MRLNDRMYTTMIDIAVCDDSPVELSQITTLAKDYIATNNIDANVISFDHPDALLTFSEKAPFDLYLLDIVMPMINGIAAGRELRSRHDQAQIIYITTSDEFAVDAFSLRAAHYLVKPFSDAQFREAMDRVMAILSASEEKKLTIMLAGGSLHNIDIDDIQYIESNGHTVVFHLKTGTCNEMRRSLSRVFEELERLSPTQFIQPYKGFIVNQRNIVTIESSGITMICGALIPIPRGSLRELQSHYVEWRFGRKG